MRFILSVFIALAMVSAAQACDDLKAARAKAPNIYLHYKVIDGERCWGVKATKAKPRAERKVVEKVRKVAKTERIPLPRPVPLFLYREGEATSQATPFSERYGEWDIPMVVRIKTVPFRVAPGEGNAIQGQRAAACLGEWVAQGECSKDQPLASPAEGAQQGNRVELPRDASVRRLR